MTPTTRATKIPPLPPGDYTIRLRRDGVFEIIEGPYKGTVIHINEGWLQVVEQRKGVK